MLATEKASLEGKLRTERNPDKWEKLRRELDRVDNRTELVLRNIG